MRAREQPRCSECDKFTRGSTKFCATHLKEYDFDRYGPDEIEQKRFDATFEQAVCKPEFIDKTILLGSSINVLSDIMN